MILSASALRPGSLLPDDFPEFSSQGSVYHAVETEDGSYFIIGDFEAVDGVARPGFAKLNSDGTLNHEFAPTEKVAVNERGAGNLYYRLERLILLSDGRLIVIGSEGWEIRNADGGIDADLFPESVRLGDKRWRPEFAIGDRIYIVIPEADGLQSFYQMGKLDDFASGADLVTLPGSRTYTPATGGELWAIEAHEDDPYTRVIFRVSGDGREDQWRLRKVVQFHDRGLLNRDSLPGLNFKYARYPGFNGNTYDSEFFGTATHIPFIISAYTSSGELRSSRSFSMPFGPFLDLVTANESGHYIYPDPHLQSLSRDHGSQKDARFHIPLAGPQHPVSGPVTTYNITYLQDGKILVGGTRRFLQDSTPDPEWHQVRLSRVSVIRGIYRRPSGGILIFGDFDLVGGLVRNGMVELDVSGQISEDFCPDIDLRFTTQVQEWADGSLLVRSQRGITDDLGNDQRLLRLDSTGRFVRTLQVQPPWVENDQRQQFLNTVRSFVILPDQSLIVMEDRPYWQDGDDAVRETRLILPGAPDGESILYRSSGLTLSEISLPGGYFFINQKTYLPEEPFGIFQQGEKVASSPFSQTLAAFPDGGVFSGGTRTHSSKAVGKWHPVTGLDEGFVKRAPDFWNVSDATTDSLGRVLAIGWLKGADQSWSNRIVRLENDGRLDPSFKVTFSPHSLPPMNSILMVGDEVWIAGRFLQINGQPRRSFARLANTSAKTFDEWMTATDPGTTTDVGFLDDPDGDGRTNLHEYAIGSDPFDSEVGSDGLERVDAYTWELRQNSEARDVAIDFEASRSLDFSELLEEGQIEIVESPDHIRLSFETVEEKVFVRFVIRVGE